MQERPDFIVPLSDATAGLSQVGGKGASLFALASAVVTDIGGPLGHSSIVAREYGIPAVMATGVATRLIRTGQMITVDGSAGRVTLQA